MLDIAGIACRRRLEHENRGLLIGDSSMLHTSGYDDELTRTDFDRSVSELHPKSATDAEEQLVLVIMMMPHEGAFELHELHFLAVQFADDLRAPMFGDKFEFLTQIDLIHRQSPSTCPTPIRQTRPIPKAAHLTRIVPHYPMDGKLA